MANDSRAPRADVEKVLAEFDTQQDTLATFCARTKALIEVSLQDAGIRYQSVQTRVKTRKKLREKYQDPQKDYKHLSDITDLAGLRVITYYEEDLDRVSEVIRREFTIDEANSSDRRLGDPDTFGYRAINLICEHQDKRKTDVEYKRFAGVRCEIQITSILSHAWSEMEHEWYDLKDAYPSLTKRRFKRLAALLELAAAEFEDIRKKRTEYERSVAVRVEANVLDLPLDAVSLRSFMEHEPIVAELDSAVAKVFGVAVADREVGRLAEHWLPGVALLGFKNLRELRDELVQYKDVIPEFMKRTSAEVWAGIKVDHFFRGASIYQLGLLLSSLRGPDALMQYFARFHVLVNWDLMRLVSIANDLTKPTRP